MSGKRKLAQFEELSSFQNVTEVAYSEVLNQAHKYQNNWSKAVFKNEHPMTLELGCGKGEYTVGMSALLPNQNFIGLDIKGARMWRGAKTAIENNYANVHFLRSRIELIQSFFGPSEVDEIWITFPDPQLKESREKKRLTSPQFMHRYFNFLKNGGIVHLKTDARSLYDYTVEVAQELPVKVLMASPQIYRDMESSSLTDVEKEIIRIPTHYEKMFREKGHEICYIKMQYVHGE